MKSIIIFGICALTSFTMCNTVSEPLYGKLELGEKRDDLEVLSVEQLVADPTLLNKVVKVSGIFSQSAIYSDDMQTKVGFFTVESSVMDIEQLFEFYERPRGSRITLIGVFENAMYEDSEYYPSGHLIEISYIEYPSSMK